MVFSPVLFRLVLLVRPQTINLLRAFSSGGFADINKLHAWNMDFVRNTAEGSKYREMTAKIEDTLRFMSVSALPPPLHHLYGRI